MLLHEEPETHEDVITSSVADNQGNFTNTDFAPATADAGRSFTLTAIGQSSGFTAQTAFKDAQPKTVTVTGQSPNPVNASNSATYTVTVTFNGNATNCTVNLTAAPTASPVWPAPPVGRILLVLVVDVDGQFLSVNNYDGDYAGGNGCEHLSVHRKRSSPSELSGEAVIKSAATNLVVAASIATTLTLSTPSPASVSFGSTGPITLSATNRTAGGAAVSDATTTFTVDGASVGTAITNTSGVATLTTYNPSALTVSGHGVQASFAGGLVSGTGYLASTSGNQTLTVTKTNQAALTLNTTSPLVYNQSETLSVTGGSTGGAVTYNLGSGSCTIVGNQLTANSGTGSCTLTATMAGNANYNDVTSTPANTVNRPRRIKQR